MAEPMVISRLRIRNYRGLAELDVQVPPEGLMACGHNAAGKSSLLAAIRKSLVEDGIAADDIRNGTDGAEVLINFGALVVHRARSLFGRPSLEVVGADGIPLPSPKKQLEEIVGPTGMDPLEFFLAAPKDRRAAVLAAMPATVTAADLDTWCEEHRDWTLTGHGTEVLANVKAGYFAERTKALAALKAAIAKANVIGVQDGPIVESAPADAMTIAAARTVMAKADRDLAVARDRNRRALEAEQSAQATRDRISQLRADAEAKLTSPVVMAKPSMGALDKAAAAVIDARGALEEAMAAVKAAEAKVAAVEGQWKELQDAAKAADEATQEGLRLSEQADELGRAIYVADAPNQDEIRQAEDGVERARGILAAAEAAENAKASKARIEEAAREQKQAEANYERLDRIVKRLGSEATAELAKRANLIPGLEVTPTSILLDGKDLDSLSGAEQMEFAVKLAKRTASKLRILVVDKMEQLDSKRRPEFIRLVREGGWQLFGALVQDSDLVIEGIGLSDGEGKHGTEGGDTGAGEAKGKVATGGQDAT